MAQRSMREESVPEASFPITEMLKSVPEFFGIRLNEEPSYELIERNGDFEIRRYAACWVAELKGEEKDFVVFREKAFKRLAHFIFGGNRSEKQMAMTAPVVMQLTPTENELEVRTLFPKLGTHGWTMSFLLPSSLKQKDIPKPLDDQIKVRRAPQQEYAVFKYSGNNTVEKIRDGEEKLRTWLSDSRDLRGLGGYLAAQYDAPFVLPMVKRNEVMIAVKRLH